MTQSKKPTRKQEFQQQRRRRQNFDGLNLKLSVPDGLKDDDYEYRWINDDGNRIFERTKQDDWDHVTTKEITLDERDSGQGTVIERVVGRGTDGKPLKAYLCKKRKDYVEQDRKAKQQQIDETEKAILTGAHPNTDGLSPEHTYIPKEGMSLSSSTGKFKP